MATQKFLTDIISDGSVESTEFKKTGGSASEFLKADGSVDSNTYLTSYTDTNTQLTDAEIAAMGYIKTDNDTQNLSISGQTLSLTNGGSVTLPDTNTQLSDGDIANFGYIKSFTDTNTQLSDGDIAAFGYIKTDTNTQLSDADIAAMGYIKTESDTQDLSISGQTLSLTNGGSVTLPDTNTQRSDSEIQAIIDNNTAGFLTSQTDSQTLSISSNQISISGGNTITVYDQTLNTTDNVEFNDINADKLFLDPTQVGGPAIGSVSTSWDAISGNAGSPVTSKFDKVTVSATSANSTSNVSGEIKIVEGNGTVEHGYLYAAQPLVRTTGSADYQGQNALYAQASHRGSGDADGIVSGITSIGEVNSTGTGTVNYIRGIDVEGKALGSADVNYLQGMHLAVGVGDGTIKEDLTIGYFDFDYTGTGKVEGDFSYIRAGLDTNSMVVDGDSRFIWQENSLPSLFGGNVEANQFIKTGGTSSQFLKADGSIDTNTYLTSYTDTNTQLSEADITAMGFIQTQSDTQDLSISGQTLSLTNGGSVTLPDTNTQLSDGDIAAFGYIKTFTDTNTQRTDEEIRDLAAGQWINGSNTTVIYDDTSNTIKINSVNTDTNTQLSDADIAAMGYIKTQSDTQDLSISGQTLSLTNGGSVTLPDTNTQLSDSDIAAMGYIKTDTNTQLSDANIAAMGYIKTYTDTNTQLSDGDIAAFGYIKTDTNTQRSDEEIRDVAAAQWVDGTNTTVVVNDSTNTIKINAVNTNTQLSDSDIAAMGYIKTESDTQDLSISGQTLSLTNGGSVTLPDTNTQRSNAEIEAIVEGYGYITDGNSGWNNSYGFITSSSLPTNSDYVDLSSTQQIGGEKTFEDDVTFEGSLSFDEASGDGGNITNLNYNNISNPPTIPTTTSQLTNNSGFITSFTNTVDMGDGFKIADSAGTDKFTVTENEEIRFAGSGATSVSFDATTQKVTISSTDTNTNTQLSDADIAAMGYIKTESDTQDLSISGQTLSLTNGGSVTLPDTNTQRSDAEIQAIINTNTAGFITDGNSGWNNSYGFVTSSGNTVIGTDSDINTSGAYVVDQLNMTDGVIQSHSTRELTLNDLGYTGATDANRITNNNQISNGAGYITSFTNTVDMGDGFKVVDGDGTTVTVTENKYLKFIEGAGININFTDTNSGSSSDPFDLTIENTITNNNQLTNGANYITDGNTNWNNTYGFITSSSLPTNVSELTNDAGYITSYVDTNTQRSDEEIRDIASAQWINGTNTTVVKDDSSNTIKINSVNTNTQLSEADITAMGFIQTQSDTQDLSISGTTLSLTNGGSVTLPDNNTQLSDGDIAAFGYIKTFTDTNTQRAIHDTPVNGATTTSISSNWAFDNVKTAVPSGAVFTDTNTQNTYTSSDFTHDDLTGFVANEHIDWTADQGSTNIHSGNYTNTNTQLSDADIAAFGYIKTFTDTNTQRAIHDTPVNGATTTSISSNWAFDNVKTAVPSGALFTDTDTNTQRTNAEIDARIALNPEGFIDSYTDTNTQLSDGDIAAMGYIKTDTNTQLSDANIAAMGYIKTDTNTQLSESEITAMGFTQSAGTVGGSGADNRIPKFSTGGANVENSTISDSGTQVSISTGSLLLNDTSFNQIKASGLMQFVGTTTGSNELRVGAPTIDWSKMNLYATEFNFRPQNTDKFTISSTGEVWANSSIITERDITFNSTAGAAMNIKGDLTLLSDVADNDIVSIGTSSFGMKAIRMYSPTIEFRSGTDTDYVDVSPLSGEVEVSGGFKVQGGTSSGFLKADGSIDTTAYGSGTGTVTGTGTSGRVSFWNGTSSQTSDAALVWNSVSNRLGVGVTTPSSALHVDGGLLVESGGDERLEVLEDGRFSIGDITESEEGTYITSGDGTRLDMYVSGGDGLHIDSNGQVGIGTTNPNKKLYVNGTSYFANTATFGGNFGNLNTTNDTGVQFEIGSTSLNTMRCDANAWRIYMGGASGVGQVYNVTESGQHDWDGSGGTNRMRLTTAGELHVDGDVIAYSTSVSDIRLKENISTIENASETVKQLRGVSYEWNAGNRKGQQEIGLIAQEVEEVLPFLVREHELPLTEGAIEGELYKTVDYEKIVGLLIEDSKEKDARIEKLEAMVELMLKNK